MAPSLTQRDFINVLLMQVVWFSCVLGGTLTGCGALAIFLVVYQLKIGKLQQDFPCILAIAVLGYSVDSVIALLDLIIFPDTNALLFLPLPGWMAALWVAFATLFLHGLQWLRGHIFISIVSGAILGPLSYYAGTLLHGVKLGMTLPSFFICYGLLWSIMTPLFVSISEQLSHE